MALIRSDLKTTLDVRGEGGRKYIIHPGAVRISDSDWAWIKAHPYVNALMLKGVLTELEGEVAGKDDVPFSKMKVGDAIAAVKECTDLEQLDLWSTDRRGRVKKAIAARLEELQPTKAPEPEPEEEPETVPEAPEAPMDDDPFEGL